MYKTTWLLATIIFLVLTKIVTGQTCKGCLNLDETSFNKIQPRFAHTLIKFDIAYPYGAKHDAFVQFAGEVASVRDLIVGEVGIKDYGQKENEDFARRQQVDAKRLPVIKLYTTNKDNQEEVATFDVDEEITVESLRDFVVHHSRVRITMPGCLQDLDVLAAGFMQAKDEHGRKQVMQEAERFVSDNEQERKTAKVYALYMKKLLDDGKFIQRERKRLQKIVAEGKVAEGKKQDLLERMNILHSFEREKEQSKTLKQDL